MENNDRLINWQSDFDFLLRLVDARGVEIGWPDWDWEAEFRTSGLGRRFIACVTDGQPVNCFNDDGVIHVVADNHGMLPGELKVIFKPKLPNGIYPDGTEDIAHPVALGIMLVRDDAPCPCPSGIEAEVILPAFKGDKGDPGDKMTFDDLTDDDLTSLQQGVADELAKRTGIYEFGELKTIDVPKGDLESVVSENDPIYSKVKNIGNALAKGRSIHGTVIVGNRKYQLVNYELSDYGEIKLYCFWVEPTNSNVRIDTAKVVFKSYTDGSIRSQAKTVTRRIDLPLTADLKIDLPAVATNAAKAPVALATATEAKSTADNTAASLADLLKIAITAGDIGLRWFNSGHSIGLFTKSGKELAKVSDVARFSDIEKASNEVSKTNQRLDALVNGNASEVIDTFAEIEEFLSGLTNSDTLTGLLDQLKKTIQTELNAGVDVKLSEVKDYVKENSGKQESTFVLPQETEPGWIRVLECVDYNAYGELTLHNGYSHNGPTSVTFRYNFGYKEGGVITQLNCSSNNLYVKARMVYPKAPTGKYYVEVLINEAINKKNGHYITLANAHNSSLVKLTVGEVPDGYGTKEFPFSEGIASEKITGKLMGNVVGNADTATKLKTPRTITVGNASKEFDGTSDVSFSLNEIGAKEALFIDQWNAAWGYYGKYDPVNAPDPQHPYMGNKIWMTYEEALLVMHAGELNPHYADGTYRTHKIRTNIPAKDVGMKVNSSNIFCYTPVEVADVGSNISPNTYTFAFCPYLHTINPRGPLYIRLNDTNNFESCRNLKNVKLCITGNFKINLVDCPLLSLESLQYLVDNAANTAAITVTVHPDVYAKLTDESNAEWNKVLTDAVARQISFATKN